MHEFKHGELTSGQRGKGGNVKSRKQAIAIALSEAGASKFDAKKKQRHKRAKSSAKEHSGRTAQQEREGRRHVGASDRRESSRAQGGKNARRPTAAGKRAAASRSRKSSTLTKAQLYRKAKAKNIPERSKMSKIQLENALGLN